MQPDAGLLRESVGAAALDRGEVRWTRCLLLMP